MSKSDSNPGVQPQFYQTPEPVDPVKHEKLGIKSSSDYKFAAQANSVLLTAMEFALASRTYPIVFTATEKPSPVAILGIRKDENLFVDQGKWEERAYIPAYVRRYPFAFVENQDKSRLVLCVDTSADAVSKNAKTKLFENGEASDFTKKALEFCTSFQTQHAATDVLCSMLKDKDVLVTRQADVTLPDGSKTSVTDFKAVDEEKFNSLPDEDFLEFRKKGLLPFVYFHLMSLANFRDLAARAGTKS
ncbi:SapC family protein [Roseibium sp.]|uniref:SapC family protein n=1 Tax=Roseibium sp. TaxID=1936156 RepID=UPI003D0DA0B6